MRIALTALLLAHGIAHLPGFAVAWKLMTSPELPYRTAIFGGRLDLGEAGTRALGIVWLLLGAMFAILAWLSWTRYPSFRAVALTVIAVSAGMCIAAWPEARLGLVANAIILAVVLLW